MERWIRARYLPGLPLGRDGRRVTAGPEHIRLSKEAALEGMVLLKNEKQALPLEPGTRVALFGKATFDYVKGGGGSGDVTVPYVRNLYEGLAETTGRDRIYDGTADFYRKNVEEQYASGCLPGLTVEPELPEELLQGARAFTDTAILSISRFSGEGWDRKADFDPHSEHVGVSRNLVEMADRIFEDGDFYFSHAEKRLIERVSAAFNRTVVVLNVGGMIETAALKDNDGVSAVLLAWQGGMEGGLAEAELLTGRACPSGKLADTFARDLKDYPFAAEFYDSDDYVEYTEDIYVGYRYFETIPGAAEKVVYPFGYGLSYTRFELRDRHVTFGDRRAEASVTVVNRGERTGREVVQVYVSAPQGKLGKPARVLCGYRKTRSLRPGESETVTVSFPWYAMASYDDLGKVAKSAWLLEKGNYSFHIGTSVRDTEPAPETLELADDLVLEQLTERMAPTDLPRRLKADGSFEIMPRREKTAKPEANGLEPLPFRDGRLPAVRAVSGMVRHVRDEERRPQLSEVADGKVGMDEFLSSLSDEDLAWLMGGQPNTGVANTYGYGNNEKAGIPNIMTADGPAGVRFRPETGVTTTAFPCGTLIACSWDPEVARKVGQAGALEAKENNIMAWLTPAVCIHRNPLCGRNFEYYSEDPLLAGLQGAALVSGIQSERIAATPKHFALNNKETNRKESDSRASERAIREIYIRQFEWIVRLSDPWTIMSSYNVINGVRASENRDLLTGILREEWGWEGMVTTDWWTRGEQYREAAAGNDMKMGCGFPERLLEALKLGLISREQLETNVRRILNLILKID